MEIVFFWVQEYYGIKEQGYNLGSEYVFHVTNVEGQLELTVKDNPSFISGFFQHHKRDDEADILNVSAFVGENGSGKSITLDFIREVLKPFPYDNYRPPHHLIVFKDKNGDYWYRSTFPSNCNNNKIKRLNELPKRHHDIIFFTPILNPKPTSNVFGETDDIDVSTRSMIYKDWVDYDKDAKEDALWDDPMHPYTRKNTQRHSQFLANFRAIKDLFGDKEIQVAKGIFVDFHFTAKSRIAVNSDKLANYDNLPISLRSALSKIYNLWREERLRDQKNERKALNSIKARKHFLLRDFKLSVVLAFAYHVDKNNWYHREIDVPNDSNIRESQYFEDAFNNLLYSEIKTPHGKSKERIKFLEPFPILLRDVINPIVEAYAAVLEELEEEAIPFNVVDESLIDVSFEDHITLFEQYLIFRKHLTKLNRQKSNDFMDFESNKGLSAGEKAYLDLFSRFHIALTDITTRIEENHYEGQELTLYLLIDEGETGFHLRWQKEYVKDLCKMLPKILNLVTHNTHLQVIFTTHSPISLSDLPSSHVVYLNRDSISGDISTKEKLKTLTFGANIQSLMAHSFFLEKGAVGKFAKDQIQKLIDTLQTGNEFKTDEVFDDSPKELKKRIEMIGEPFLRDKLMEMLLDSKKYGDQLRMEALEEDLKRKTEELNRLKKK